MAQQMNTFAHQDIARRNTRLLVVLFGLAVITLVSLVALLVAAVTGGVEVGQQHGTTTAQPASEFIWQWDIILAAAGMTLSAISLAVLYKWYILRPGGRVVAEQLGGRRLEPDSRDQTERKVLNVVEEMAIAANMPVPPVYLLDKEPGINAFAAGYTPKDAVIGLTRGAAEQLTRAQLQGVVAHEIAHILNGDMRLNIRIIAVLNGILFLAHAGYILLRFGAMSRRNDKNPLPIIGLGLLILGGIGILFGNIIKAAVSRQREYLADASAVQFTREPEGLAGALQQIGAAQAGSQVKSKQADETAHLFFGQAISKAMSVFATHPPLDDRIKRIMPHWDGEYRANPPKPQPDAAEQQQAAQQQAKDRLVQLATALTLPATMVEEARSRDGSEALLLALMLSDEQAVRERQLQLIAERHSEQLAERTGTDYASVQELPLTERLPLVELAMPALKQHSAHEAYELLRTMEGMMAADDQVTLYEWCLSQVVSRYLKAEYQPNRRVPGVRIQKQTDAEFSLSVLAWYGHDSAAGAKAGFAAGAEAFGGNLTPFTDTPYSFGELSETLDRIDQWSVREKERMVQAWLACARQDGQISPVSQKLLFTLSACIGEPLPELPADANEE